MPDIKDLFDLGAGSMAGKSSSKQPDLAAMEPLMRMHAGMYQLYFVMTGKEDVALALTGQLFATMFGMYFKSDKEKPRDDDNKS